MKCIWFRWNHNLTVVPIQQYFIIVYWVVKNDHRVGKAMGKLRQELLVSSEFFVSCA